MKTSRQTRFKDAKRIVVKVGSGVLTEDNGLNINVINSISRQIFELFKDGREVILVSSGAMACGVKKIGLDKRPDDIPGRQAVSAVGQAGLILEYEKAFGRFDKKVAQVLLTNEDFNDRQRYLNARNTMRTLLEWGVMPVINENDTVAVEEIKFGDNDNLAAMITLLMEADLLINLTDIDGLYDKDPRSNPDAEMLGVVSEIDENIEKLAGDIPGALGTGGMKSKITAARKTTTAGIPMVIAKGSRDNTLTDLFSGQELGTYFVPREERLSGRKCWIAFSMKPKGVVRVTSEEMDSIVKNGVSLLSRGITDVEGDFGIGAPVKIKNCDGKNVGIGIVNYSAADIRLIMGLTPGQIEDRLGYKPYEEVIHKDNLAVL